MAGRSGGEREGVFEHELNYFIIHLFAKFYLVTFGSFSLERHNVDKNWSFPESTFLANLLTYIMNLVIEMIILWLETWKDTFMKSNFLKNSYQC